MRPARPAWTGSPDRRPSEIPAVEIPEEIRARAAAQNAALGASNGHVEGGVIVTPPGPGGDVHGDPGLQPPSNPPTPPSSGSAGPT